MDYLKFKNWKGSHSTTMQDLTFAKPYDLFIFTRVKCEGFEGKQVLFAENMAEAIGYVRHIFLYDILTDTTDDLEIEQKSPFDERQGDAIKLLNFWYRAGKIAGDCQKEKIKAFLKEFNSAFSCRDGVEYELQILNGANELRNFLIRRYSEYDTFDKKRLCDICSNDFFLGKHLKDFLDKFLM